MPPPRWLPGGFAGVDIFFVISGYLISSIVLESVARGTFSLADFYVRRIKRIFPALILMLATMFTVGWFVLYPDEHQQLGKHVAAGVGFVSNVVLWRESGYFDVEAYVQRFRASQTIPDARYRNLRAFTGLALLIIALSLLDRHRVFGTSRTCL